MASNEDKYNAMQNPIDVKEENILIYETKVMFF